MSTTDRTATSVIPESRALLVVLALALALGACTGRRGPAGPEGPPGSGGGGGTDPDEPTPTQYALGESVPALRVGILQLLGASGPNGEFLVGDTLTVEFTLQKDDGKPWSLDELDQGEALVSGPSFNYQRVLPAIEDVRTRAVEQSAGLFRLTFADPIPASFAPPYNDTTSFGANGGELAGRALLDGTYTVGLSFTWDFQVGTRAFRRVGEATADFLLGTGSGVLAHREVTTPAHCNRCHGELQAHDGRYRTLTLCLLCHTSGAEDANDPAVAGGTPAVTIDSRVLFHKLHSGRALPSVNGVASRSNGGRNYDAEPVPLRYVRADKTVRDFSDVGFPAMPNRVQPMPKDTNYDGLTATQKQQEDRILAGPTECAVCHGDPDGDGPIVAPAQHALIDVPSRRACGACHDDVNFANSYRANGQVMPPQNNDNGCNGCHDSRFPGPLAPVSAHPNPLERSDFNSGLKLTLSSLAEAGANDGDGTLDPGEGVAVDFTLTDDSGRNVGAQGLSELHVVLAGPTSNFQVLLDEAIPPAIVTGAQPFHLVLPERLQLEFVGDSTAALDAFQTERAPHRTGSGVSTSVFVRTDTAGGASRTLFARRSTDNFVDVVDPSGFARNDFVVIDDGVSGAEEYLQIQFVQANRLWFSAPNQPSYAPALRHDHARGASVAEVVLAQQSAPSQYTLEAATGTIHEVSEFGAGRAVLVSYTSDYRVPATYPTASNASPSLSDQHGKWSGKALVSGTYVASLSAAKDLVFDAGAQNTTYRASSPSATVAFLVGDASTLEPDTRVPDGTACNACHQDLSYHGTFRGFDTCILCHGASGTEDLPRYVAADAPETTAHSVEFRSLVHKIHRGRELGDPSYEIVGRGPDPYPDNFATHGYTHFATLPAFPGRTLECTRCHGAGNDAALFPSEREHPTEQERPLQTWRPVCAGCHDSEAVTAHIESNTAPDGAEACSICHAPGEFEDASVAHRARLEPR